MLTVISPAKKLDFENATPEIPASTPEFADDAVTLARTAGKLDVAGLQKLMRISEKLAKLNYDRFRDFAETPEAGAVAPAVLAFAGDTYQGLEAASLEPEELSYAQRHLRILSGLYGLLRPMDMIQPYRLEMGSRLATQRGKSLYDYWGDRLSKALNEQAAEVGTDLLLNCASVEYFSAVKPEALNLRVITPVFMEDRENGPKIVSFYAKRARGAMARFVIRHRIDSIDGLKDFDTGGYAFRSDMSEGDRVVFVRG